MSDVSTGTPDPVAPVAPAPPDFAAMESIAEYRKVRETVDAEPEPVKAPEPVEAKPEPVTEPDPASEAGKALAGKKKSLQARIDEITREKHDTARERDTAKAEADRLRAELAALKTPQSAAAPPSAQSESTTPQSLSGVPKPVRPKQSEFETWEQYEDAKDAYTEKLAEWTANEKIAAERQASSAQAAERAQYEALSRVYDKGRAAHADFDALLEQSAADGVRWSPFVTQIVLTSENGHEIAVALAKDAETAKRLSAIQNPAQAGMEMGRFLARLEDANSGPSSVVAPVTTAPDPIKPVGGTSAGASTTDPSEINSIAAWRKKRSEYL